MSEPGAMTSVEKLAALLDGAPGLIEVEDEETAQLLSALRIVKPMVSRFIPDDPAELDELLIGGARWALLLRGDEAWQPSSLEELMAGPDEFDGEVEDLDDVDGEVA